MNCLGPSLQYAIMASYIATAHDPEQFINYIYRSTRQLTCTCMQCSVTYRLVMVEVFVFLHECTFEFGQHVLSHQQGKLEIRMSNS